MLIKIDNPILGFIDFKSAKGGSKKCVTFPGDVTRLTDAPSYDPGIPQGAVT
jgi:hypothetical protein